MHGGYTLEREPCRISVREIVRLLDGGFTLAECIANPRACDRVVRCVTRPVWRKAGEAMEAALDGITLEDLARDHRALESRTLSYTI
jgi:Rrf2 family protein